MGIFEALGAEEWGGLMVPHFYMGPLPAFFYPAFQLMDYGVHSWDIRAGHRAARTGWPATSADLLAPFMMVLWSATAAPDPAPSRSRSASASLSGPNAGDYRVKAGPEGFAYEPGERRRSGDRVRVRPGQPGADRVRPHERRHVSAAIATWPTGTSTCSSGSDARERRCAMTDTAIDLQAIEAERERIRDDLPRPRASGRRARRGACTTSRSLSSDVERTVRFYQDVLEFPLTDIFENRDYQGSNHFFFDIGNGNLLAFFDFPGLDLGPYAEVLGGLHHIAISVEPQTWERLKGKLDEAGVDYLVESGTLDLLPRPRRRPARADRRPARRDVRRDRALSRDGPCGPGASSREPRTYLAEQLGAEVDHVVWDRDRRRAAVGAEDEVEVSRARE